MSLKKKLQARVRPQSRLMTCPTLASTGQALEVQTVRIWKAGHLPSPPSWAERKVRHAIAAARLQTPLPAARDRSTRSAIPSDVRRTAGWRSGRAARISAHVRRRDGPGANKGSSPVPDRIPSPGCSASAASTPGPHCSPRTVRSCPPRCRSATPSSATLPRSADPGNSPHRWRLAWARMKIRRRR